MWVPLPSDLPVIAVAVSILCIFGATAIVRWWKVRSSAAIQTPVSVNYHFSRKCNYECGFCFHTETTSNVLKIEEAKRGLKLLKEAGMKKLNFAGGEPFLYPSFLRELLRYGKEELKLDSISIVSNGSKVTEKFLLANAEFLDILAISCDSFIPATNIAIGRGTTGRNVEQLMRISGWCQEYGIQFKMNTVVCSLNWDENMTPLIEQAQPFRWKVFQCLIVTGENDNEQRKRDARDFLVTEEQWKTFSDRHKHLDCFVPESNSAMKDSYLILDEDMCFLDKGDGVETKSGSILKVGVQKAMSQVKFDVAAFKNRGGEFFLPGAAEGGGCSSAGNGLRGLGW